MQSINSRIRIVTLPGDGIGTEVAAKSIRQPATAAA